MFCTNCGKEIPNDSRVCGYCGKPIQNPAQTENGIDTQAQYQNNQQGNGQQYQSSQPYNNSQQNPNGQPYNNQPYQNGQPYNNQQYSNGQPYNNQQYQNGQQYNNQQNQNGQQYNNRQYQNGQPNYNVPPMYNNPQAQNNMGNTALQPDNKFNLVAGLFTWIWGFINGLWELAVIDIIIDIVNMLLMVIPPLGLFITIIYLTMRIIIVGRNANYYHRLKVTQNISFLSAIRDPNLRRIW